MEFKNEYVSMWLNRRQNRKSESTYLNDQSAINKFLKYLEDINISIGNIEFLHADNFLDWLETSEGLDQRSAYDYFSSVRMFYDYYIKVNNLDNNPFRDVDTKHIEHDKEKHNKPTLDESEMRALVESCESMRAKALFSFMASTGARLGEAVRLKKENLDIGERKAEIITLKNKNQESRPVYFDRKTRRILKKYKNGERLKYASEDTEYFFLSADYGQFENDGFVSKDRARVMFKRAVANCEAIEDKVEYQENADGSVRCSVGSHILRRSFCQNWVDSDGDIMSLKNAVGWKSLETAKEYLDDELDRETRDKHGVRL